MGSEPNQLLCEKEVAKDKDVYELMGHSEWLVWVIAFRHVDKLVGMDTNYEELCIKCMHPQLPRSI